MYELTCPECQWEIESETTVVPLHHVFRVRGTHWDSQICKCRCKGSGSRAEKAFDLNEDNPGKGNP
jgi:hypothetical protein